MGTDIAVLITVFNRRSTTLRCLEHLSASHLPNGVTLNIFLVDDGSTDGTADAVRSRFSDVRIIQGDGSLFWTGGMHLADQDAWQTAPNYLLWLNDDVEMAPTGLSELLNIAHSTAGEAIVVGAVIDPDSGSIVYGGHRRTGKPLDLSLTIPNGSVQTVDTMNGNVVLIPAAVRSAIGPPDLTFSHNMADMDYGFRAAAAGFDVLLAGQPVGHCSPNDEKSRWQDPSVPLAERWALVSSKKAMPLVEWWRFTRRHTGIWWPRYFLSPYVRTLTAPLLHVRRR